MWLMVTCNEKNLQIPVTSVPPLFWICSYGEPIIPFWNEDILLGILKIIEWGLLALGQQRCNFEDKHNVEDDGFSVFLEAKIVQGIFYTESYLINTLQIGNEKYCFSWV